MIELGLALAAAGVAAAAGFAVRRAWRSRQDLTELPPPTGASLGVEGAPEGSVVLRVEGEPPDVTVLARESVRFDGRALETGDPAFDSVALATGPETLLAAWLSDDVREELRWLLGAGVTVVDGVGHAPRRVAGSRDGQALLDRLAAVLDRLQEAVAAPIARLGRVDPSIPLSRLRLEHLLEQAPASAEAARMVRWALEAGQSGFDDTVRRRMARHQLDAIVAVAQDAALPVGVRATALRTLGSGNFPTEALKTLRRAVRHEDESIRRTAVERLGLAKRDAVRKALGPLQIAAEDERASVRRAAMTALGRLGDEPGVEADSVATLAAGLEDSAASVSRAAAKALARPASHGPPPRPWRGCSPTPASTR